MLTSAKKVILNGNSEFLSTIERMREKGFSNINFYFSGSKRHNEKGLENNQILILGYRFHVRPDRTKEALQAKKLNDISKPQMMQTHVITPVVAPIVEVFVCDCGEEFDHYIKWSSHAMKNKHSCFKKIQR